MTPAQTISKSRKSGTWNGAGTRKCAGRLVSSAEAHLFGASDTLRAAGGPFLEVALRTEVDRDLAAAHAALGDDEFTAVWRAARSVPLDQTIAVALSPGPVPDPLRDE